MGIELNDKQIENFNVKFNQAVRLNLKIDTFRYIVYINDISKQ